MTAEMGKLDWLERDGTVMTLVKREESIGLYYSKEKSLLADYHCHHIETCAFWLFTDLFNLVKVHK